MQNAERRTQSGAEFPGHSALCILHSALKWWPARVTRPVLRIKSPLHHFNACRPLKWSQSRVLPSAELAYETGLSAGSIAKWIPHPELHRAKTRVPGECIADNALGALKMVGARRLAPAFAQSYGGAGVQGCLILSQVGLLFPVNHAPRNWRP